MTEYELRRTLKYIEDSMDRWWESVDSYEETYGEYDDEGRQQILERQEQANDIYIALGEEPIYATA